MVFVVAAGAKALIPDDLYPIAKACVSFFYLILFYFLSKSQFGNDMGVIRGTAFVAPQVLVNVNHCELSFEFYLLYEY